jgi:Restriction endonuclease AspBHI N-terminal/Restriction endonuclease
MTCRVLVCDDQLELSADWTSQLRAVAPEGDYTILNPPTNDEIRDSIKTLIRRRKASRDGAAVAAEECLFDGVDVLMVDYDLLHVDEDSFHKTQQRMRAGVTKGRLAGVRRFLFDELSKADLVVDATYEGEATGKNVSSEPLGPLTGTGNWGGFRFSGPVSHPNLVVLYTTMSEPNWPDSLDEENGLFVYFGDNRKPGFELHDRRAGRGGNEILRRAFELAHAGPVAREEIPPFLVFSKGVRGRDAVFRGLAAPGAMHLEAGEDLVAIWKSKDGQRFQNYRSIFTLLDVPLIRRAWLSELQSGSRLGPNCPAAWRSWVTTGRPKTLLAERISRVRVPHQQLGGTEQLRSIGRAVYEHFISDPALFEVFAADVVRLMDQNVTALDVTRPTRDGGRDGIGRYRIGMSQNYVTVDFAMEAKCHAQDVGLGVKVISRLISRLRHRQFGVLVTTSFLARQAYEEIVEDQHPIVVCSGGDIAELLVAKVGVHTAHQTRAWLSKAYPMDRRSEPK